MKGKVKNVKNSKEMKRVAIYIRVSTFDQDKGMDSQEYELRKYCKGHDIPKATVKFYRDKLSGKTLDRPAFEELQADIFMGHVKTVLCWKLDRLSRSLRDGINTLTDWLEKGIRIVATAQQLDFSGAVGKLIASVLFAVAEIEREGISENVKRGIQAARARGVRLGKRPMLFAKDIVPLLQDGMSITAIADKLGKTRQAIYNALRRDGVELAAIRTG